MTTGMVAPVREAITAILSESLDWPLTIRLYEWLDVRVTEGVRPRMIIRTLPEITSEAFRMKLSGKKDLADKLYCVARMLRDVLDTLYFSTGGV